MTHRLSDMVKTINSFDAIISTIREAATKANVPETKHAVPKVPSH